MDDIAVYLETRKKLYTLLGSFFYSEATSDFVEKLKMFFPVFETMGQEYGVTEISEAGKMLYSLNYTEKYIDDLEKEFSYVFLTGDPFAGLKPVTPHESVYLSVNGAVMQEERDQVMEMYYGQGVGKRDGFTEPEDHIKAEFDFMSFLTSTSIKYIENDDIKSLRSNIKIQETFLTKHICKWITPLCQDVEKHSRSEYFKLMAKASKGFIDCDVKFIKEFIETIAGE